MTYLSDHAHADTKVSSPNIVELLEPFCKSSWSEAERLLSVTPSMKVNETTLSSSICHESDVACLKKCNTDGKECRHDPEFIIAAEECVRSKTVHREKFTTNLKRPFSPKG